MKLTRGFVQVYTGNGKGKTTAALGLVLRAAGAGLKVCMIQFLKGRTCSEHRLLSRLPGVTVRQFGTGCFIRAKASGNDREQARKALRAVANALQSNEYDLVVADEINVALALGLITGSEILELIGMRPEKTELVLTGRGATPQILKKADLVTEMHEKKHYFSQGVTGRRGIEL